MPDDEELSADEAAPDTDDEIGEEADTEAEDEGADDDADEGGEDDGPEAGAGRQTERAEGAEKPRKRGASEVIREEKRRRQDLERQLAEERVARQAAERTANERRQGESEAVRRERIALMSDAERTEFLLTEQRDGFQRELGSLRFEMQDRNDRSEFRALCREDKALATVKDEVETELAAMRRNGNNVSREALANFLLGKRIRERRASAATKQRRKADDGIRRETARPGRARSDVATDRGRGQGKTAADRLKDVVF